MIVLLMGLWLILNGRVTGEILITGVVLTALLWGFSACFMGASLRREWRILRTLPRGAWFVVCLLRALWSSNLHMLKLVWRGEPDPVMREIVTPAKTNIGRVLVANAITLTPGTITVQLADDRLQVHCIDDACAAGLSDMALERQVVQMEAKLDGKRV